MDFLTIQKEWTLRCHNRKILYLYYNNKYDFKLHNKLVFNYSEGIFHFHYQNILLCLHFLPILLNMSFKGRATYYHIHTSHAFAKSDLSL